MFNFDEIKTAVEGQNQNENSLIALASYLYNIDFEADKSIKIYSDKGRFLVKEFGGKYADLMQAKDFAGLVRIATNGLKGQTLLAQKAHLLAVCCGINIGAVSSSAATCAAPKARPVQAKIANKKKVGGSAFTPYFAEWQSSYGDAVLAYFKTKIGDVNIKFLERYGVRPLLRFTMPNSEGGVNDYKELLDDKVTFSYTAGDWSKKIQPYQPKDKKTLTNAGANQYAFGLAQLPKSGENLFIFEGESDVLLAAKHGFSAICFGGVTKPISNELAAELKARFPNIIVFFDNETKAQKAADELAQKHGFRALDALFFFSYVSAPWNLDASKISDICDLLAAARAAADKNLADDLLGDARARAAEDLADKFLAGVLGEGLTLFGDKKAIQGDKFSIEVKNALRFNINQYVSEPAQGWAHPVAGITTAISQYKKVCLQAAAGAGKSHALAAIIPQLLEAKGEIKRVLIALPTVPLSNQLNELLLIELIKPYNYTTALITGAADNDARQKALFAQVVLTTIDNIAAGDADPHTLTILDESHQLPLDFSFRAKATRAALEVMQNANHCLLLSATPNHLFNAHFGFKLVTINVAKTNSKNVRICYHSSRQKELLASIIKKAADAKAGGKSGALMIKVDDSTLLRAGQNFAKKAGLTSEVFTSAKAEFKENSPNYKSLMQTGELAQKVDIIFTTCLIEAGVSIKDSVYSMHIIDTLNVARLIQQMSRPRYNAETGENEFLDVFIYINKDKPKGENQYKTAPKMLAEITAQAQAKAAEFNGEIAAGAPTHDTEKCGSDLKDFVYELEGGAGYAADMLNIFHHIEEKSETTNFDLLKSRLLEDSTVKSVTRVFCDGEDDFNFSLELTALKDMREAIQKDALSILLANKKEDAELLITYILSTSKDVLKRQIIAKKLGLTLNTQAVGDAKKFFLAQGEDVRATLQNEDARIIDKLDDTAHLMRGGNYNLKDALELVKSGDKDAKKQADSNAQAALIAARRKKLKAGTANVNERNLAETTNDVYREFSNYIKGINAGRRAPFLIEELVTITNKVITAKDAKKGFKPKTAGGKESVDKFLKTFYTVTPVYSKTKGEPTRYILERLKAEK